MSRETCPPALRHRRIGIVGAGTMGQALITGLLARGVSRRQLMAAEITPSIRAAVGRRCGIEVTDDAARVARRSHILLLAVKPQQFPDLLSAIAPSVCRTHLVISIAAGIRLGWLQARLPRVPLVRVMPNLPAMVGCGFSALTRGRWASAHHLAIATAIFTAVGDVVELPERHFDAMTAVSGSGPAYLFFLVDAWEQAACSLGLPQAVAARAIRRTLHGSLRLLESRDETPQELMQQVASKGGTTEAALNRLAARRVAWHMTEALRAAARRSKELSWS